MSITSGKVIILTGLAALTLIACGGEGQTGTAGPIYVDPSGGGNGGGPMMTPEIEDFSCDDIQEDVLINAVIDTHMGYEEYYHPSEVILKMGQILKFQPYDSIQNLESGVNEVKDGKFHTPQGRRWCLRFHIPGTFPFFSLGAIEPVTGTLYVE